MIRLPLGCREGRHSPSPMVTLDHNGTEHTRCRRCGCELSRRPMVRGWHRSGLMG